MVDSLDAELLHALQLDGRAPFSRIAEVLEVSEQTVARRYRRLRSAGVLRVVGGVDGTRLGYTSWTLRIHTTPDASAAVGAALAERTDTFFVHLLSGGTEISCFTQTPLDHAPLLDKLPRTSKVLAVSAHSLLHGFTIPGEWAGLAALAPEKADRLRYAPEPADGTATPDDQGLLAALAVDGRASHTQLATATGWSESTVRRRLENLRRSGALRIQLEFDPKALGYKAQARLWLTVRPSGLVDVARTLATHPEVSFAGVTTGATNLMAEVSCTDDAHFYRYLTERVARLDAVQTLETAPVLRTLKRIGTV
ncbi:Lrp/AsnC family transcriptional regulator [Labedaea rhizosphaerae]|uniref:DNA-binding Lrp family transcriptional regulator n=1 Tax=Labedaea rhizosphaerae TaxID=598644 RepID=A0A4R6SJU6_LABRH|nr:AsnC family transcriptional regulator [Labedaea rhizosphaerae]TDQ01219.1 DNA-binding Lrp family transcriptional regulator [Labedaea rhizosphaerae]